MSPPAGGVVVASEESKDITLCEVVEVESEEREDPEGGGKKGGWMECRMQ